MSGAVTAQTDASANFRTRQKSRLVAVETASVDPNNLTQADFIARRLPGNRLHHNPMLRRMLAKNGLPGLVKDDHTLVMYDPQATGPSVDGQNAVSKSHFTLRMAHPHATLRFDPKETTIGVVTCGGLCPGLNDVIRGISFTAVRTYGVKKVVGFRFGFWGLSKAGRGSEMDLDPSVVDDIHRTGGTMLGTSRGPQNMAEMAETLRMCNVNILIAIGGDGTQRGAAALGEECRRRGLEIGVVGVPKTIDNDLSFSHRTFGFETAVQEAVCAIRAAHSEAASHKGGIGVVKVMGRHSGFIAAQATISAENVNICLIPEAPLTRERVVSLLEARFATKDHCVVCVAEGFGQDWAETSGKTDASGNKRLLDSGLEVAKLCSKWIKSSRFRATGTVKYIDPSYMIRACPPTAADAAFCTWLASLAVHEALAGTTEAVITFWYNHYVTVPIRLATSLRKEVDPRGRLWHQVREQCVSTNHRLDIEFQSQSRKDVIERRLVAVEQQAARLRQKLSKL